MKPSDEELNRAAAEACGWKEIRPHLKGAYMTTPFKGIPPEKRRGGQQDNGPLFHSPPDYCTDRNALPELWAAVEESDKLDAFESEANMLLIEQRELRGRTFAIGLLMAPARLHVLAALKALGRWPEEWTEEA